MIRRFIRFAQRSFVIALAIMVPCVLHAALHLHFGCEIYEFTAPPKLQIKLVRKFPGELCLFQKDGSVVMTFPQRVVKYDFQMKEIWSYSARAHHQINASTNGEEILVIGSEIVDVGDKQAGRARGDLLLVLDQEGKLRRSFSLNQNKVQFQTAAWRNAELRKYPMVWDVERFQEAKWELTHVNTFYQIPDNNAAKKSQAFSAGGYLVNDISLMQTFILDKDMKKIVWQRSLPKETWNMTHDTQILRDGRLIYYDNGTAARPFSRLVEYDLLSSRETWSYPKKLRRSFYAKRWGGLQFLDSGNVLFTDISGVPRVVEIDREGQEKWTWELPSYKYLQQARLENLTQFLSKNKGI
jgi:hypothetical protein